MGSAYEARITAVTATLFDKDVAKVYLTPKQIKACEKEGISYIGVTMKAI